MTWNNPITVTSINAQNVTLQIKGSTVVFDTRDMQARVLNDNILDYMFLQNVLVFLLRRDKVDITNGAAVKAYLEGLGSVFPL